MRPDQHNPAASSGSSLAGSGSPFVRWLCQSLDEESAADPAADRPAARLRPVQLSEVEALGLLVVALEVAAGGSYLASVARRLVRRLVERLDRPRSGRPPVANGV